MYIFFLNTHLSELLSGSFSQTKPNKSQHLSHRGQHISQLFSKFPYQTRPNISLYLSHTVQHKSIRSCFCAAAISHMLDTRNFRRYTTRRQFTFINSPNTILPSYTHSIHNWFPTNHFAVISKVHNFIQKIKNDIWILNVLTAIRIA